MESVREGIVLTGGTRRRRTGDWGWGQTYKSGRDRKGGTVPGTSGLPGTPKEFGGREV